MFGIVLIAAIAGATIIWMPRLYRAEVQGQLDANEARQIRKLWGIAVDSMKGRKTLRAEKALLAILRFDEKNADAYNRLGILYAKQKKYKEAVECFEIAESLDHNATSLHNAGLIFLETEKYAKAAQAFEQAIALEGDLPNRFIAYAKTQEKLGKHKQAIDALEQAFELDKSPATLKKIGAIHQLAGDEAGVEETKRRLIALMEAQQQISKLPPNASPKYRRIPKITKKISKAPKLLKPIKTARSPKQSRIRLTRRMK